MKRMVLFIVSLAAVACSTLYAVLITFSESREYGKLSFDYYLLTPSELSSISHYCESSPRFVYSAADGPKPAITHMYCSIGKEVIADHLSTNKFEQTSKSSFRANGAEIEVEESDSGKIVKVTAYERL